jgi:hypothetical protein
MAGIIAWILGILLTCATAKIAVDVSKIDKLKYRIRRLRVVNKSYLKQISVYKRRV